MQFFSARAGTGGRQERFLLGADLLPPPKAPPQHGPDRKIRPTALRFGDEDVRVGGQGRRQEPRKVPASAGSTPVLATPENKPSRRAEVKPNLSVVQQFAAARLPKRDTFNAGVSRRSAPTTHACRRNLLHPSCVARRDVAKHFSLGASVPANSAPLRRNFVPLFRSCRKLIRDVCNPPYDGEGNLRHSIRNVRIVRTLVDDLKANGKRGARLFQYYQISFPRPQVCAVSPKCCTRLRGHSRRCREPR